MTKESFHDWTSLIGIHFAPNSLIETNKNIGNILGINKQWLVKHGSSHQSLDTLRILVYPHYTH